MRQRRTRRGVQHSYAVFEKPIALTKDGYFELPQGPGLGVTIRKDLYRKAPTERGTRRAIDEPH